MNHELALIWSNWSLVVFMIPLVLFVIFYIPIFRKNKSALGWAILGNKVSLIAIASTIILRNFFADLPGLALVRLLVFVGLVIYLFYDYTQLMKARRVAKNPPQEPSDIVNTDDTPDKP